MSDDTLLVRNRDTVHRRTCRYNVTGAPWVWAEGRTRNEVEVAEKYGLRFCRTCKPLDALPVAVDACSIGLISKYEVRRINDPDGKHDECRYFVLDPKHDPIARDVLVIYATKAFGLGYEQLDRDLMNWIVELDKEDE